MQPRYLNYFSPVFVPRPIFPLHYASPWFHLSIWKDWAGVSFSLVVNALICSLGKPMALTHSCIVLLKLISVDS